MNVDGIERILRRRVPMLHLLVALFAPNEHNTKAHFQQQQRGRVTFLRCNCCMQCTVIIIALCDAKPATEFRASCSSVYYVLYVHCLDKVFANAYKSVRFCAQLCKFKVFRNCFASRITKCSTLSW